MNWTSLLEQTLTSTDVNTFRAGIGARIKSLRKQKGWIQKELAHKLRVTLTHLNKYESGRHLPPVDKLVLIADLLDVTVDFLLTGESGEKHDIHNRRLLERLEAMQDFDKEDQDTIIRIIDAMILKSRVSRTMDAYHMAGH